MALADQDLLRAPDHPLRGGLDELAESIPPSGQLSKARAVPYLARIRFRIWSALSLPCVAQAGASPHGDGNFHEPRYRLRVMNTLRACSAVGLALVVSLTLPSCTNGEEPQASPTPQVSDSDSRAGLDDVVVTEAALEPFIGMDASDAYAKLRRQHFKVRFGPALTRFERNNITGHATHPDVVIEALELGSNEQVIITEVSWVR